MTTSLVIIAEVSTLLALALAFVVEAQRRYSGALRKLACTDPLTGLANRREFTRALEAEISRTSRSGRRFALVLLDVDGLKLINDRCGHRAGDRAILRVANALRVSCRASDTAARIGGDEFAVLLPETDTRMAMQFLTRVHTVLSNHRRGGTVTVSGGVAEHPAQGPTAEALFGVADLALYAGKYRRSRATPASLPRLVPGATRELV